jgi:hypothetical protein
MMWNSLIRAAVGAAMVVECSAVDDEGISWSSEVRNFSSVGRTACDGLNYLNLIKYYCRNVSAE